MLFMKTNDIINTVTYQSFCHESNLMAIENEQIYAQNNLIFKELSFV